MLDVIMPFVATLVYIQIHTLLNKMHSFKAEALLFVEKEGGFGGIWHFSLTLFDDNH